MPSFKDPSLVTPTVKKLNDFSDIPSPSCPRQLRNIRKTRSRSLSDLSLSEICYSAWPIPIPKRLAIQFIRVFCKGIGIHNSYFWGMGHANGPFLKGLPFKLSEQFLRNCNSQFLFLRNGPCTILHYGRANQLDAQRASCFLLLDRSWFMAKVSSGILFLLARIDPFIYSGDNWSLNESTAGRPPSPGRCQHNGKWPRLSWSTGINSPPPPDFPSPARSGDVTWVTRQVARLACHLPRKPPAITVVVYSRHDDFSDY